MRCRTESSIKSDAARKQELSSRCAECDRTPLYPLEIDGEVYCTEECWAQGHLTITAAEWGEALYCHAGHEFTPDNTSISSKGARVCNDCRRTRYARMHAKAPVVT